MEEEIMVCKYAEVIDNDHGSATIDVALETAGSGQSFLISPDKAYDVLRLFNVERLSHCRGKPIIACREEAYGYIVALKRLSCYEPFEVKHS